MKNKENIVDVGDEDVEEDIGDDSVDVVYRGQE